MPNALNDIVQVSITAESSAVSRQGFATPLLVPAAAHTNFAERLKLYSGSEILAEMLDDGFLTTDAGYLMAEKALAQTPRPASLYIGRVAAGDANVTASMNAIAAEDNESWHGFAYGTRTDANLTALALWTATQNHIYVAQTASADALAGTEPNILDTLRDLGYRRTMAIWHSPATEDYADVAMLARGTVADLDVVGGNITWANKELAGVTPDELTGAQRTTLHGYNATTIERRGGKTITREGKSMHGEFLDIQIGIDWLDARLTEDVFAVLTATQTKIPYTQAGIDVIEAVVRKRLDIAVQNGFLDSYEIEMPKITDVLSADRASRLLRNVIFRAVPAGAIHTVQIVGKVSV